MTDSSGMTTGEMREEILRLRRENEALRAALDGGTPNVTWLADWLDEADDRYGYYLDEASALLDALSARVAASLQGRTVTRG